MKYELANSNQDPIAWGIVYDGGILDGKLYAFSWSEKDALEHVARLADLNHCDKFKVMALYT